MFPAWQQKENSRTQTCCGVWLSHIGSPIGVFRVYLDPCGSSNVLYVVKRCDVYCDVLVHMPGSCCPGACQHLACILNFLSCMHLHALGSHACNGWPSSNLHSTRLECNHWHSPVACFFLQETLYLQESLAAQKPSQQ
jgi:hypothetical protein